MTEKGKSGGEKGWGAVLWRYMREHDIGGEREREREKGAMIWREMYEYMVIQERGKRER